MSEGGGPARRNPPVLKKFGQHFLHDAAVLQSIADAIAPTPDDTVLEIGPGRGALTELLIPRAGRVVAVELDRALAAQLNERYARNANVQIVQSDILEADIRALVGDSYILAGNVPYYITTPIIFKSLEPPVSRRSVFLVQREVAERIAAKANDKEYGALTVNVAATSEVEIVRHVGAASFTPPPRVDSAVIRITPRAEPLIEREQTPAFRMFVQAAFGQRRKQIQRVLRSVRGLSVEEVTSILNRCGVDPTARPETLSPTVFVELFRACGRGSAEKGRS
ncbi:MAG: 16S rRNA (adenine(1518)-N(6)/adenine(1519)-N(6))-dimethyltransferase RsmA [Gemmatimonadota bacterium]|nr:16S rRNA (adenine(1518)-N(6)/adenine(1519)-N(6))-dimethyltransferase RsmA [Gemmatimonadota bacterium]